MGMAGETIMGLNKESSQKKLEKLNQQSIESVDVGVDLASNGFSTSTVEGLGLLVQARMEVGRVNDPAEHEADAMALDFLRWQQSSGEQSAPAQRQISSGQTSRSTSGGTMETGGFAVDGALESEIARETGRGSGLDGSTRGQFEGFFGVDLGGVRLHADSKAAELSRSLGAEAFTVGNDVFFGEGQFNSGSSTGMGLLAHELTHVVQQGRSSMRRVDQNSVALLRSPFSFFGSKKKDSIIGGADVLKETAKATFGTVSAIQELWKVFTKPSTTEDKGRAAFEVLKTAVTISKMSLKTAASNSGMTGDIAAAIPGLGVAQSVNSFADNLSNKLIPLWTARSAQKKVLDNLRKGQGEKSKKSIVSEKEKSLDLQIASMETLVSLSGRQIGNELVKAAGDLTMIVGHVATLATGPFGAAVVLLGASMKLSSKAISSVWEWVASHRARKLRKAEEAAQRELDTARVNETSASSIDEEKASSQITQNDLSAKEAAYHKAYMALVKSDANSAFKNVLEMAFAPLREKPPMEVDPSHMNMLRTLGVSDFFINTTTRDISVNDQASIDYDVAVEEAAKLVSVGPPMSMNDRVESLKENAKKFGRGVTKKLGIYVDTNKWTEEKVKTKAKKMASNVVDYVKKKKSQGTSGVKTEQVNKILQEKYPKFREKVMASGTDVQLAAREGWIKKQSEDAVKRALVGAPVGPRVGGATEALEWDEIKVVVTPESITVSFLKVIWETNPLHAGLSQGTKSVMNPLYTDRSKGSKGVMNPLYTDRSKGSKGVMNPLFVENSNGNLV